MSCFFRLSKPILDVHIVKFVNQEIILLVNGGRRGIAAGEGGSGSREVLDEVLRVMVRGVGMR